MRLRKCHWKRRVEESLEEIEMQDGELKIDSDFYSVENRALLPCMTQPDIFIWKDSGDSIGSRTFGWRSKRD